MHKFKSLVRIEHNPEVFPQPHSRELPKLSIISPYYTFLKVLYCEATPRPPCGKVVDLSYETLKSQLSYTH